MVDEDEASERAGESEPQRIRPGLRASAPWACSAVVALGLVGAMLHLRPQALSAVVVLAVSLVTIVAVLRAVRDQ